MIILDSPYVSDILIEAAVRTGVPVLENEMARQAAKGGDLNIVGEEDFIEIFRSGGDARLYSNSENAIGWIEKRLGFTYLPEIIGVCKDKVRFRRLLQPEYPDFFFASIDLEALSGLDTSALKKPFIVKPAVGFFSRGVYRVESDSHWPEVLALIKRDVEVVKGMYPPEVLDTGRFMIEELVPGDEFAVDLYYDGAGEPVILNILHHLFASEKDMSDRTYLTSAEIIRRHHDLFREHLVSFGRLAGLRNVPMHVEFRQDGGRLAWIEANPMRFAAWCTTDLAWYAWGINTVEHFMTDRRPDWDSIFQGREDKVYPLNVAFVPDDIDTGRVKGIDYESFEGNYRSPISIRRMDYAKYRVFAFVFSETDEDNRAEIETMLRADMRPYVIT